MARYPTEQQNGANASAPDQGSGPGQSHSYFDDALNSVGFALGSATAAVESGWNSTKQEAHAIGAGIEAGAEYYYKEADHWAKQLLGAKTWSQLHHIANVLLGPESFNLGVACGVVKNLGETAFGLLGLVKMLILAGLYEELHGPPGLAYTSPQAFLLHSAGWVFDKILGKQMKDADTQVKAIFTEVGKIFKDPKRFFGAAWASASGDYVKKWHEFESLVKTGRAVDQFKAGVIAGDVLTTVVLTVLAIVSGVGAAIRTGEAVVGGVRALIGAAEVTEAAAANLAKEAPELVKAARGLEDVKPGASAAEDAEGATEKPIKDQSTAKKGVFGEAKADAWMDGKGYKKLNGDLVQIGDTPKGPGIDGVWEKPGPPPEYVVTDAKYGSAGLNTLADGTKQMSPSWINDRLPGEVGDETADEIKAAGYQRWVLQVDDQGVVTQRILPPGKP